MLLAIADALLAVVLAPDCASCHQPLDRPTLGAVCHPCWDAVRAFTPPLCDICGDPLPTWRALSLAAAVCPRCRRRRRPIDRARAAGPYDDALRAIVHAFKYEGRRSLAGPLGSLMRARGGVVLDGAVAVVPVPLHASRLRERGFNQALDLCRHLGPPVVGALRRARATASQASLPAAQRHGNVRDAFVATRQAARLRQAVVVVVDDVTTTGATLDACATALKGAGVREVRGLTAARVVTPQP